MGKPITAAEFVAILVLALLVREAAMSVLRSVRLWQKCNVPSQSKGGTPLAATAVSRMPGLNSAPRSEHWDCLTQLAKQEGKP